MPNDEHRGKSGVPVVLTVSRVCKLVSVAVGTVGVRPFTAASYRI